MKKLLSALLLAALLLTLAVSCQPKEFVLMDEDMRRYFSMKREDYTGVTLSIPAKYEVTDAMVDTALEAIVQEHMYALPNKTIEGGDFVSFYLRGEYEGRPLPEFSNYADAPIYLMLSSTSGDVLPELYTALVGTLPADYMLLREYAGIVRENEKILVSYYGFYYDDENKRVMYEDVGSVYYDLATDTLPACLSEVQGKTIGETYFYNRKETVDGVETVIGYIPVVIDGVERQVHYAYRVSCRIVTERAVEFSAVLPDDTYAADSPYAYLNGKTVTLYAIPSAVYRRPTLNASFFYQYYGFTAPAGEDVVTAFKAHLREKLEADMAEAYLYDYVYNYFFARLKPHSLPKEIKIDESLEGILSALADAHEITVDELLRDEEVLLRSIYGLNSGDYKDMEILDALRAYVRRETEKKMLLVYLLQVENLRFTDAEYTAYIEAYVVDYNASHNTSYTVQELEAAYEEQSGITFREALEIDRVKKFLYENNTFRFVPEGEILDDSADWTPPEK